MCFRPIFPTIEELTDVDYCTASLAKLKGISFCCLNVRSLMLKIDSIKLILQRSNIDCLVLNETFLNKSITDLEISIDGYDCHRFDRTAESGKHSGGGIVAYVNNKYDFHPITDSVVCSPHAESAWVKLSLKNTRPTYLCCFYRPPDGSVTDFLNNLNSQIESIVTEPGSDIVMMGDANIDLMKNTREARYLKSFLNQANLSQVINKATRVNEQSSTLIDHIYVNNPSLYSHRGILDPGLSDHHLTFVCRKRAKISNEKKTIFIRNYRNFNTENFCADLAKIDWTHVIQAHDVDEAIACFNFEIISIINKHLPFKRIRTRINSAPWVTGEFLSLIDAREYAAKQYSKCPCQLHLDKKKEAQRLVQRTKNQLKRNYVETTLNNHKNDPKKLWRNIRNFWPSEKSKNSTIKSINGESDNHKIANALNNHFGTIGDKFNEKIDSSNKIEDFLPDFTPPIFDIKEVNQTDIAKAIDRLSSSPACGFDEITAFMVKTGKSQLLDILSFLFNMSIRTKRFPQLWKVAKVTPLFKSGDHNDENNYRPISILPTLGKVLERLIHDQLYSHLTNNKLLTDNQSGFRKGSSTGTCLVDFLHHIYGEVDGGGACGVLFLDLSKAFDTVNHEIIRIKLKALGVKESSVSWFVSYLTGRTQYTNVNNTLSEPIEIRMGVPQGSILGPLIFICYVNDLPKYCSNTIPFMYADDTALLTTGHSVDIIEQKLQSDFDHMLKWFAANRLCINTTKTKTMLFCSKRSTHKQVNLNIYDSSERIEEVDTFKYLGLYLDRHLCFDDHIDKIIRKVNQRTGFLWRMRNFINQPLAKYLYQSLIHPVFQYCDFIYDGCTITLKNKLQVTQNAALRAVRKCGRLSDKATT